MQLQSPLPSKDGKKLFVVGMTFRGELTSFDVKTGKPSLFLGGISADWVDASRDGKQVVYVSYPQGDLWKSNADGTNRVQLTFRSDEAGIAALVSRRTDDPFLRFSEWSQRSRGRCTRFRLPAALHAN